MSKFQVGDKIITPGGKVGEISSVHKKITITWENGRSCEYTLKQLQAWNYRKSSQDKEAIAKCSDNLTSAQELGQDFVLPVCNSDLSLLESQKSTNTAVISSPSDTPVYTTTTVLNPLPAPEAMSYNSEELTSSQLRHPVPPFQLKEKGKGQPTSEIVSPQFCESSKTQSPSLQPLKMSQACSTVPTPQVMSAVTSGLFYSSFPSAGMMRNGWLWEVDTVPLPSLESEYCWLPSPGALSFAGKGRPPGQTKQEAWLKKQGLLQKGEVLNPAILCEWYAIPPNWLDPSECRAATELLEECAKQLEIFSILAWQVSPSTESSTSILLSDIERTQQLKVGDRVFHNGTYGIIRDFDENVITIAWDTGNSKKVGHPISTFSASWSLYGDLKRCNDMPENFLEENKEAPTRSRSGSYGASPSTESCTCPSCKQPLLNLNDGCGVCGWTLENFLEENKGSSSRSPSSKRRQRKGCLYKYLENKRLKDGCIVSYPRVIGDKRDPDNPKHWRWGFNWEEKIDGEWKGRSIGSIPVGAIPLIEDMRSRNVPIEEIISFIRKSKSKK